jgi:ketosteroid isomerase-like protein
MQEAQNTKVAQEAYAAFGRGDVQSILDRLADDVIWKPVYGAAAYVPTSGERRGKPAVATFFGKSPIGKTFDSDFAMVFTLQNGKVSHFQEFSDSAAINAAYATVGAAV